MNGRNQGGVDYAAAKNRNRPWPKAKLTLFARFLARSPDP